MVWSHCLSRAINIENCKKKISWTSVLIDIQRSQLSITFCKEILLIFMAHQTWTPPNTFPVELSPLDTLQAKTYSIPAIKKKSNKNNTLNECDLSYTKHLSNAPSVVFPAGGYIKKTYLAPQPTCWLMRAEMREVHPVIVELLEGSGKNMLSRLYILAGTSMIFKPDRLSMKAFWITNGIFAPL